MFSICIFVISNEHNIYLCCYQSVIMTVCPENTETKSVKSLKDAHKQFNT